LLSQRTSTSLPARIALADLDDHHHDHGDVLEEQHDVVRDGREEAEECGQPIERSIWVVNRELDGIRRLLHNETSFDALASSEWQLMCFELFGQITPNSISRWDLQ